MASGSQIVFYIFLVLLIIGGLNWGLYAVDQKYDLVELIGDSLFGPYSLFARIVYALVAVAAVVIAVMSLTASNDIYKA